MKTEGTTERVLRLLGLLQRRPSWTAAELAEQLDVTDRSIRRDIERLRALGYPVRAVAGVGGGYQLGAGSRMPPLLLDDDEALAIALSLRLAAGGTVSGVQEAALSTMAKLDQMMPPRLRAEVRALHSATEAMSGPGSEVDAELMVTLARACRDAVRVRFQYTRPGGELSHRTVEPLRMVTTGRRWYLMAYDIDRQDWRTFRLDRIYELVTTTWRFPPREHPDPLQYVQDSVSLAPYSFVAKILFHASAAEVGALVPPQVGRIEGRPDGQCLLTAGGEDLDWMIMYVARLGFEAEILEPAELRDAAAELAHGIRALGAADRESSVTG